MGSPLGITFANFYTTHVENKIFDNSHNLKPTIYCSYVDDCFKVIDNIDSLIALKRTFEANFLLQFTHEIGTRDNINFLDVQVSVHEDGYQTTVFQKPTNSGIYLHYDCECPQRYNDGTISALVMTAPPTKFPQTGHFLSIPSTFSNRHLPTMAILTDFLAVSSKTT